MIQNNSRNLKNDQSIQIASIDELLTWNIIDCIYEEKEWIEEHECSNIVISLWTTSAARIHLLRAMQQVVRAEGCTLLYTDTDSQFLLILKESTL
uniref:DNA-directed DNA polymerase n=1 Tax=Meloidogyne incognita TaxID=6306 RepID=A0A914P3X6_MELIC